MGNSQSSSENKASTQPSNSNKKKTQQVSPPKHILWGCSTPEEHYQAIQNGCDLAADQHGLKGLQKLGFEFRMIHVAPCTCRGLPTQAEEQGQDLDVESLSDDDDEDGDEDFDKENDDSATNEEEKAKNTSTGTASDQEPALEDDEDVVSQSFMVPVGTRISDLEIQPMERKNNLNNDAGDKWEEDYNTESTSSSQFMSRSQSSVSLFSLATHHSMSSNESSVFASQPRQLQSRPTTDDKTSTTTVEIHGNTHELKTNNHQHPDYYCALRLYHTASNTQITEKCHQEFIAHGKMYDEVARLCMEYAQDVMIEQGNLEWRTICPEQNIRALVSKRRRSRRQEQHQEAQPEDDKTRDTNASRGTVLLITGKGKVGAGIFSRRLCMTMGLEPATALPFVQEAVKRDLDIVMLDPNSVVQQNNTTTLNAMQVVEMSLEEIFFNNRSDDDDKDDNEIYVLAHSMAGSQLVRYLLNKAINHPSVSEEEGEENSSKRANNNIDPSSSSSSSIQLYLRQIRAIVFTDSNHNINWVKKYAALTTFFTQPQTTLYIKSHKVHEDAKALGEEHHDCHYWKHRFGTIRTLWAGTNEHALTNHMARFHIWKHFDDRIKDVAKQRKQ